MCLGVLDVDLAVELEFNVIGSFLCVAVAGEGQALGLEIYFEGFVGDVGGGYCEMDVVTFLVCGGGALGPENWGNGCQRSSFVGGARCGDGMDHIPSGVVCELAILA